MVQCTSMRLQEWRFSSSSVRSVQRNGEWPDYRVSITEGRPSRRATSPERTLAAPRSRKAHFDSPLCHQVIPFEIRRRRELCYSGVWADQRQIPGWHAYVRNWYAWWGFPSRIVNYHNLLAGWEGERDAAMPISACIAIVYTGDDGNSISLETKEESPRVPCISGRDAY